MRIDFLKQLLAVPSPSGQEAALASLITDQVRRRGLGPAGVVVTDKYNNVYIRKGKPGVVPCVAAHLDTVPPLGKVKIMQKLGRLFGVNEEGQRTGIGADDKAGVFICLELLERFDDIAVILFAREEIGGVGAQHAPAEWFAGIGYLIEFDCPGQGLVSYTSGGTRLFANDGEFIQTAAPVLQAHGLTQWQHHPFSDVMVLRRRFEFSCLNLSCGYYRWHRPDEYLILSEVAAALKAGTALIKALGCRAYPFPANKDETAQPLFAVTELKVMEHTPLPCPAPVILERKKSLTPTGQLPDALLGGAEVLEEPEDNSSMWDNFIPNDIPFFKMALLDQLLRRPYHTMSLEGPFNLTKLCADYRDRTFRSEARINPSGHANITRVMFCLGEGLFGYLDGQAFKIYAPTPEAAKTAVEQFRPYVKPTAKTQPHFFIVSIEDQGAYAESVAIERPAPTQDAELALHYGKGFLEWERCWLEKMGRTDSGLSLLLGPPGCGKTSYLRALMSRLLNRAVFYFVPVDAMELLTSPRFVTFWVNQTRHHGKRRKIAILEDAEELLLPREASNRDRVSNLLNIADGFLGEYLKLHVVATTNVAMRELDPAIIRPGRLIGSHEFRRLTCAEAEHLAETKGLSLTAKQPDYSLAEIYCGAGKSPELAGTRQVGFSNR